MFLHVACLDFASLGSCLKSLKKLAVRALSDLKQSAIASCFKSDKARLLVFLNIT